MGGGQGDSDSIKEIEPERGGVGVGGFPPNRIASRDVYIITCFTSELATQASWPPHQKLCIYQPLTIILQQHNMPKTYTKGSVQLAIRALNEKQIKSERR